MRKKPDKKIRRSIKRNTKDNIQYYLYMLPVMILIIIFSYIPLFGIVIAFQDYKVGSAFISADTVWVGLKHFQDFISSFYFERIIWNTLFINLLGLLMGFWVPIAFALLLNEVVFPKLKKVIQTVSYMPHFISSVVVVSMFLTYIGDNGIIPKLLSIIGISVNSLNTNASFYPWYYTFINVWKSFGWSSILYLSTITSIDQALYEAAEVDGAGRWKKMWYITLPQMKSIILIQLIFAIGGMLGSNTEMILLFYNPAVYSSMDVIGTYVYRDALLGGRYSFGTASSLLMSTFSFTLVWLANKVSRKFADYSLW